MGAAAYNRGSRAIRAQLDRERMPAAVALVRLVVEGAAAPAAHVMLAGAVVVDAAAVTALGRLLVFYL